MSLHEIARNIRDKEGVKYKALKRVNNKQVKQTGEQT